MKNCSIIASEWGLSIRSINNLCRTGKIPGAVKIKGIWQIPDDAVKPADGRTGSGKYIKIADNASKKPLPIGISDYVRAQSEYYYVDKTLLIKELLDRKPLVSLFTRPRRFGKTLNMDMLRVFFEKSKDSTDVFFKDKAIWKCGATYKNHQGKYPVIFLSFKDVKFDTWAMTINKISELLQEEFARHMELLESSHTEAYEKTFFKKILDGQANEVELSSSLQKLSKMLANHHKIAPIIIIDEYDTPIQEGHSKDFDDEITGFMRNFFSGAFKDNKNLSYGFLTGILRIAQESIFSGLNNLSVNSVMDAEYDEFFGFTEQEVSDMMNYYGFSDHLEELKQWYHGYHFGNREIYNPWSVINYISKNCVPQAYWVNTGRNEVLDEVLKNASDDIIQKLQSLLSGTRTIAGINQNFVYRNLSDDPDNIFSLLLMTGYLKAGSRSLQSDGTYLCEVSIPNQEIASIYRSDILTHLLQIGAVTKTTSNKIAESLYLGDRARLQAAIGDYMDRSVSFYDSGKESFYHGLTLGLIAMMDETYRIKSNRESGDGRFDISMFPKKEKLPGIIMEIKWKKKLTESALNSLAAEALRQIDDLRYYQEMHELGIKDICKFGIAFSGKKVKICLG